VNLNNADLKEIVANMAFPNKRNVTPRYQQISLIQQIELTNFNKFFLQIRRMMVYGFIKMLGFIWVI
jgi:hypothetical protein